MAETTLDALDKAIAPQNFATRATYVRDELGRLASLVSDLQTRLSQLQNDVKQWGTEAERD